MCTSIQDLRNADGQTDSVEKRSETHAQPTYSVSTWDHELQAWDARDRCAAKWELRRWLRKLYAESWDHVSILIERND